MPKRSKPLLIGLVWLASYFRIQSLFYNHFHDDEALFATWARLIAVWRDPLLLTQPVDKPPLLFYLQALFFPLIGPEEWAARLPNYIASLLLVPVIALLTWHLYQQSIGSVLAALFMAMAPLTIQFSSTAFTDPLLGTLIMMSVLLIIYKPCPTLSGLAFGLAAATKHQAWLFLPLIWGFVWLQMWSWRLVRKWLLGAAPIIVGLVIWEVVRSGNLSIWSRQVNNFGGIRLAWSWELFGRLEQWAQLWQLSIGTWIGVGLLLLGMILLAARAYFRRDDAARVDLLLILFVIGYMTLHWILAIPIWDRYLVPLLPLLAIIMARTVVCVYYWITSSLIQHRLGKSARIAGLAFLAAAFLLILILQLPAAFDARAGRWPLGRQRESDQGAWQIANFLADEPYGTVLYDHWYSWQWQYHLFDKKVYVSWFQDPQAMIDDLAVFADKKDNRYLVLPASNEALPVKRAITSNGYDLQYVMQTGHRSGIVLYRIGVGEDIN